MMKTEYEGFFPIGHFYSLYPDLDEIKERESIIYNKNKPILDIDFHEKGQQEMLERMIGLYSSSVPEWRPIEHGDEAPYCYRYSYNNEAFPLSDAVALHCMLRFLKPGKLIEVGSGWSSAVTLDTQEYFLDHLMDITFIEPYPRLLRRVLKDTDHICLLESSLQNAPLDIFESLEPGDMLFIDSTHVSKPGSDVNYLFFEILPRLKRGVYIHLHDVFIGFEYPKSWVKKGQVWNGLYLLRAFLQNNKDYEVVYFQNMAVNNAKDDISIPWLCKEPYYGSSFYMKKC